MGITVVKIKCEHCGKLVKKNIGHVNRAKKNGNRLFCNQKCFGKFWRHNKTKKQLKAEKADYDRQYRKKNAEYVKWRAAEYFKKDYAANPEKYKKERQRRMKAHVEYCRQPEYRKKKQSYDERYRAYILYGEFAEAALILKKIENMVDRKMARFDKDCHNKKQKRERLWKSSQRSILKKPSGKPSSDSKEAKSNTPTRTRLHPKRGKSSAPRTPKSK